MKIVFFGTPQFVVPVLQKLQENFQLVGVVTAPDKKVGRKQILTPSPVKLASQGQALQGVSLQIFTPEKLNQEIFEQLRKLNPDLFVVAAYGKIIPQSVLDIPREGALNIHPSLLPKYRGPSPIQETILNGDKITGISFIKMDAEMDHGPLIYTKEISLSSTDNFQTLSTKMFLEAAEVLPEIIEDFVSEKLKPNEQNHKSATFCKMIKKESGYFDINPLTGGPPSLEQLDRMIRAYYPWPGVWTKWHNKIIKFLPKTVILGSEATPESDSGLRRNDKFVIQMEGKKPVKLEDFLRGHPDFPVKSLSV